MGGVNRQVTGFFAECRSSPSVALGEECLCRVLLFTECQVLCGTRESLSSPSAILPRVQHSGKILFPECPIFGTRGSQRHSGNFVSPVVTPNIIYWIQIISNRKVVNYKVVDLFEVYNFDILHIFLETTLNPAVSTIDF